MKAFRSRTATPAAAAISRIEALIAFKRSRMIASSAGSRTTSSGSGWPLPPRAAGIPTPFARRGEAPRVTFDPGASGPEGPIRGTVRPPICTGWPVAGFTTTGGMAFANGARVTSGMVAVTTVAPVARSVLRI